MRVGQLQLKGTGLTVVLQGTREEKEKQGNTPQQPTAQQTTLEKETVSCSDKHKEVSCTSNIHCFLVISLN